MMPNVLYAILEDNRELRTAFEKRKLRKSNREIIWFNIDFALLSALQDRPPL
jgi:hypothetical protein